MVVVAVPARSRRYCVSVCLCVCVCGGGGALAPPEAAAALVAPPATRRALLEQLAPPPAAPAQVPTTLHDFVLHGRLPAPGQLELQPEVVELPVIVDTIIAQRLKEAAAEQGSDGSGGSSGWGLQEGE